MAAKITNPLTVVGIFATFTETGGVAVLPFLEEPALQSRYIWFLIAFPTVLLLLFFTTLWFRPAVLFSPEEHGGALGYLRAVVDRENRDRLNKAFLADPAFRDKLLHRAEFEDLSEALTDVEKDQG